MTRTQSESFAATEEGTRIALELAYELKSGVALKALVDLSSSAARWRLAAPDSGPVPRRAGADRDCSARFPGTRRRLTGAASSL